LGEGKKGMAGGEKEAGDLESTMLGLGGEVEGQDCGFGG